MRQSRRKMVSTALVLLAATALAARLYKAYQHGRAMQSIVRPVGER